MKNKDSAAIFLKNFLSLCDAHHETGRAVLIKLGLAPSTIANWRKGSLPNVNTMNKIAQYFNVSINTLVGMTDEGFIDYYLAPVSEELGWIVRAYQRATEDDRQIVKLVLKKYETN